MARATSPQGAAFHPQRERRAGTHVEDPRNGKIWSEAGARKPTEGRRGNLPRSRGLEGRDAGFSPQETCRDGPRRTRRRRRIASSPGCFSSARRPALQALLVLNPSAASPFSLGEARQDTRSLRPNGSGAALGSRVGTGRREARARLPYPPNSDADRPERRRPLPAAGRMQADGHRAPRL